MFTLDRSEILTSVCKVRKLYGLYLHFHIPATDDPVGEACRAAPFLDPNDPEMRKIIDDGFGFLFFNEVKTMRQCFEKTRGPDGPNPNNPYKGPVTVYLVACSPNGEILGDNTESSPDLEG